MNRLGKARTPFLFILSYDKTRIFAQPLQILDKEIFYKLEDWRNYPVQKRNRDYTFSLSPVDFDDYRNALASILEEIRSGNTYLLNLTFATPVRTDLTLKEIFTYARAKFKLYFKGGPGWLWAKYVNWDGKRRLPSTTYKYSSTIANGKGISIGGGLGLCVEIDSYLSLYLEGEVNRAKISGFKGELEDGETGTLYYFEEYDPDLNYWQAKFQILAEEPKGDEFRSIKEAEIDLSGFSLKIGVIIKF